MPGPTMNTQDAVSANFAECFVTPVSYTHLTLPTNSLV